MNTTTNGFTNQSVTTPSATTEAAPRLKTAEVTTATNCDQYAGMLHNIVYGVFIYFLGYIAAVIAVGCLQEICWKLTSVRQMSKLSKTFFKVSVVSLDL